MAYGILVPQPGIEPKHPASKAWSLNQWTIKEVPLIAASDHRSAGKKKIFLGLQLLISFQVSPHPTKATSRCLEESVTFSPSSLSFFPIKGQTEDCECRLQSCPTLWNPMDHSLPRSSVHGILQARILEWVARPGNSKAVADTEKIRKSPHMPWRKCRLTKDPRKR